MIDLDIKTGDEVQELAESFKKMQVDLNDYIETLSVVTAEREKIGAELNVAKSKNQDLSKTVKQQMQAELNLDDTYSVTYVVVGEADEKSDIGEQVGDGPVQDAVFNHGDKS